MEISGIKLPVSRTALKSFNKLVSAGEQVIAEKGYFASTISDIVKCADLSTGTFYIYFESKYALYAFLMNKYKTELKEYLAKSIEGLDSRLDIEVEGIKAFVRHAADNPMCYNIIWESLYIDSNLFFSYYEGFSRSYVRGLKKAGKEARNVDFSITAYALMGISNFLGLKAIKDGNFDQADLDKMGDTLRVILSKGLFDETETAKKIKPKQDSVLPHKE
ncbi:MAG: TetR/AcrR family transcriptional regulator [Clostridia bacterium]|nr:TetR/AcrR family transcriptional regulator [Clostridia bacterium]